MKRVERTVPLHELCERLTSITHGVVSPSIDLRVSAERYAVTVLPTWMWVEPKISLGNKTRGINGARLFPIPVTWDSPTVIAHTDTITVNYRAHGLGVTVLGSITINTAETSARNTNLCDFPVRAQAQLLTARAAERTLTRLHTQAHNSLWEIRRELFALCKSELVAANQRVFAEISDGEKGYDCLDDITLEDMTTRMMYAESHSGLTVSAPLLDSSLEYQCVADRLIHRLLHPGNRFNNVEPSMYVAVDIRRSAESMIRRHLGDPHSVGRKVRRLAREGNFTSLNHLVTTYQQMYPTDKLSTGRARSALTAIHSLPTETVPSGVGTDVFSLLEVA